MKKEKFKVTESCGNVFLDLGFTQTEVARRLGISQSAYAQQEAKEPVRKATREKIAQALGIAAEQLAV